MYKYYTIYETKNLINGKIYVGKHMTNNLCDNYLGSGDLLKKAITKYGKKNFEKKVLFVLDDMESMNAKEAEIVNSEFVKRRDTYNAHVGGKGSSAFVRRTEEEKKRMYNKAKETRANWSDEERARYSQTLSSSIKRHYNDMNEEERLAYIARMTLKNQEQAKNLSPEKKKDMAMKQKEARKNRTPERKKEIAANMSAAQSGKRDKTTYEFTKGAVKFTGTKEELIERFPDDKIHYYDFSHIHAGRLKTVRGWSMTI